MQSQDVIEQQYREAVDALVEKVQKDPYVLAAIVAGSFSYAQVWEKSDLDVELIGRDSIRPTQSFFSLIENGVNIHANITPRNAFKQNIESAQQGSFMHSYFSHSTLLFSRDDSIQEWYDKNANRDNIGERDKQFQLLNVITNTLPSLIYAEKQFYVNKDILTVFLSLLNVVQGLARIEVLLNNEIPAREVIQPARRYNPDFFNRVYTALINCEKNKIVIQNALDAIHDYLDERQFIFQPVLDYLAEQKAPRAITELNADLGRGLHDDGEASLNLVCQWLAWKGIIRQIAVPLKLTAKSQIAVEEPAYYYDGIVGASSARDASQTQLKADIHAQIHRAVARISDTLEQDMYILAAILTNNLAKDNVWEKTAVHITLIFRDGTKFKQKQYQLIEEGVPILVQLHTRSAYRKMLDSTLQGSTLHSILADSRLLFSKDSLFSVDGDAYFPIGDPSYLQVSERDMHSQLFNTAAEATAALAKAEKWFHLKRDMDYTFLYITYLVRELARIEVLMHGETPRRKAIYQALKHNPDFFKAVFTNLIDKPKDEAMLGEVIEHINQYLEDNLQTLFKPLLDFFEESGDERTITDIYTHFGKRQLGFGLACEWLAQKGVIEQYSAPVRLTKDSKVSVEEPAYYYDANNPFLFDM
ncbi:hypothetical protein F4054_06845 [Candidatus Poribacteria bacterium]|nr:hypothetical protein [Candidatus Poribacteria bacterium]MYG07839.1 hypothetical protein [Candidatus Poribacteria bacterium]MYK21960.1 hypothetical protein [Candidatus Poribacteria bacterium]